MTATKRLSADHHRVLWILAVGLLTLSAGCSGEDSDAGKACNDRGELHDDHCHCDEGYQVSEDGQSCLAEGGSMTDIGSQDAHNDSDQHDTGEEDMMQREEPLAFAPQQSDARVGVLDDGARLWTVEAHDGATILAMELYEAFGGPTATGETALSEADTSYATCGTCLILRTGCVSHGDHFDCTQTWMPRAGGRVVLEALGTSAGESMRGALHDILFQEVSISQDFTTSPVGSDLLMRMEQWNFETNLDAAD